MKKWIGGIAGALALALSSVVMADTAAQPRQQVPGYYRVMVGDLEVTALNDGHVRLGANLVKGMAPEEVHALLQQAFIDDASGVQTAVNAYVLSLGAHVVLVDAGSGGCMGNTVGHLPQQLRAAGFTPEQIDVVLLTHLHPDHACGLTRDGQAVFPNATVYASQREADYWLSEEIAQQQPEEVRGVFAGAQAAVAPYRANDRFKTFNVGDVILPDLDVVAAYGHTPGHVGYLFNSGTDHILLWGDVVHSHAVQFMHPQAFMVFDVDGEQAVATRRAVFAKTADERWLVGGAHLPFPGLGHVRHNGQAYAWVPLEYGPMTRPAAQPLPEPAEPAPASQATDASSPAAPAVEPAHESATAPAAAEPAVTAEPAATQPAVAEPAPAAP